MLKFNQDIAKKYKSKSQIVRVLSEDWFSLNSFCPNCSNSLSKFANNSPVADFFCPSCSEEFELKSKSGSIGKIVADGDYQAKINRLSSNTNPSLFVLSYEKESYSVNDLLVVPKHFFTPEIIIKRKPLSPTSRRAGWIGSNISIASVPSSGRIFIIKDGKLENRDEILEKWHSSSFLNKTRNLESRGWLLDIMLCIDKLGKRSFSLSDIYNFVDFLKNKHPQNNNIEAKIRQQLQILRDKKYLKFTSRGNYELL